MAKEIVAEYNPSKEERRIIKRTQTMFDVAFKAKSHTTKVWRECEELYMGEHWKGMNMPNFKNQITLDMIGSAIDTMIPILSNRPPRIDIIAVGDAEIGLSAAEILQKQIDELWVIRDMQNLVPEWLLDYLVYGNGILKVHFNNEDDLPDADVVDPFAVYVNPSATKMENAEYIAYAATTPLYEIREKYENGKYVKAQSELEKYEALKINDVSMGGSNITQVTDTKGTETNYYEDTSRAMEALEERALLIECYARDYTKEYIDEEIDGKPTGDKMETYMYPGMIRQTTICNGVLLYDGPSKYPFLNKENHMPHPFPFVVLKNGGSAHSFWGKPEPKRLKSLNLSLDRLASQIMDNTHLMANPMWVVDETTDVVDQISNKPGSVIRKKGPGMVQMQQPASMPGYVFNFYELMGDMFETISGVNKATQGKADANVTSGVQAQIYRQASTTKIDFKARSVDQAIQTLGTMWIAMIKFLGTEEHTMTIDGAEGPEERKYVGAMMQDMNFDVRAKAGSMLPENREYIEAKIMQLMQMGVVTDPLYLLEHIELPGKEKLIRSIVEQQKAMAGGDPMSPEEMEGMGTDEDAIMRQLQQNPDLMNRVPGDV
tara:strand:+ start:702 stop:2510 length:1809 start_codon:yes stop_codon:yes gene_type:complete